MSPEQGERNTSILGVPLSGRAGLFTRMFNRVFSRHLLFATLLVLQVSFLTGNLRQPHELVADPDIWWHLADARILTTTHHFIRTEPYSFSVAGEPWVNPEWLSEIPFWLGYKSFGLAGIYLVNWLALSANLLLVYGRSSRLSMQPFAALCMAALGFMMMTLNDGPRTFLIAYLAMSAEMAILEAAGRGKTRLLWLLPPLFCVWVNLHGSWLIGLALLALYILCGMFSFTKGAFEQDGFSAGDRNRLLLVLAASLAALFVNPYGWRLIWNPFDMMFNQKLNIASVQEWQPLNLAWPNALSIVLAIGLLILANCLRGRKWKIYEFALLFFAFFAAFDHVRFAFMAAVLAIPLVTVDVARSFFSKPDEKTIPAMNALLAIGIFCLILHFFPSNAAMKEGMATRYPLQSIASIQPSWRTFNQDTLGGMMDFNQKSPFVDSRWDTFEHHGQMQDFFQIVKLQDPLQTLDRNRIDHILIPADWPLATLLDRTPEWQVIRREGAGEFAYVLYARTSAAPAPLFPVP
jgi:hypothetical protein